MAIAVPTAFTRLVRRQASLVVGLALVVCAGVAANIALQRWRTRLAPVALGPETLLAGTTVEGNLAHGEKRHYPLPLTAGRYVLLRVDQLGIDVVLRLLAADGTPFAESDGLTGDQGPDWISMISEKPGAYTLEIEGGGQSNGGRFALRVAEAGVADHRNRLRVAADTTAAAGRRWYFEGTRPSAERAEKEFEQALSTYAVAEDPGGEADSLLGLATARAALGRHSETVAPLSRALELARSLRDDRRAADVLWFRGLNYTRVAEWRKAVDDLTTALPLFRKLGNAARSARAAITLSDAHDQLGDRRQALRFATYGLLMARNSGDQYALCEALQARGSVALWIGRPRDALEPLAEALQISRQFGFMAIQSGILTSLGVAQRQLDRDVEARQTLGAALEIARQRGDHHHESEVLLQIAGTYKSPAEAAEKRHVLEQSLAASREVGNPRGEAANLTLLANLEEKAGNLVGARRLLEQAIAVREEQWRRAPNANLQAYYIADQYPTYEMYIDVLVRLHAAGRDPEAAALAFRVSEGIRARALRQQLVRAAKAVADPIPQKILDAPRKSGQDPESITISEVQRHLLDPDTILLEYSLGKDRSYLFAASPSSFRVFELPAKETIDAAARAVTSAATARNVPMKFETTDERQARVLRSDADFRETANALSQMLLAPVENEIPGKRLLLVSDGGLASVPFGALPVPGRVTMGLGGGTSVHEYVPLAIANELIELPSASVLRDIRRQRAGRRPSPKMLAVLADPVLGPEDPRLPAGSGRESAAPASVGRLAYDTTDWHRLPWARVEAEAILGMVPADQRFAALGFDANLETATDPSLAGYRIVHFATHALVDSRDSAASGIVLSAFDAGGRRRPDLLSLSEIYRLRLPAELVVLSACRTALGEEVRGEGLVGLARGFMYAGASRVVVSLWDVQDEATADLMKRFYSHLLQDGSTPAAALRLAQTEIWRSTEWSPPYYWAGFRLQGEWR